MGTTDVKPIATKIRALHDLDAVVSTTDGAIVGSLVAKSLKELGSKTPVYSITLDQAAIDVAQGGLDGAEFLTFLTPRPEFIQEYTAKFKTQVDIGADSAYDAVQLLAKAIRESGTTDSTTVAKQIESVRNYSGMSGELVSDGKRGFTKRFSIKTIVNGKPQ